MTKNFSQIIIRPKHNSGSSENTTQGECREHYTRDTISSYRNLKIKNKNLERS